MFDPPVEMAYRTTVEVSRSGPVGKALGWLGKHPVAGGLICGVGAVVIAGLRVPEGVAAEPVTAGVISALVVGTWVILFFLMRGFFEAQSFAKVNVLRKVLVDDEKATWLQNDETLKEIAKPQLKILTTPVPKGIGNEKEGSKNATAWPIWLVLESAEENDDERIIFETRDPASRARDYEEVPKEIIDGTDERLPRAIALPLLRGASGERGGEK